MSDCRIYELTKISQQKSKSGAARLQINATIRGMKSGHFSNEKTINDGTNFLKSGGAPATMIVNKAMVREVRVTQDLRIFFYEANNAAGLPTLTLICLGHMKGGGVSLR